MQKIILAFCLALAVANGEANVEYRSDDYINMLRQQHNHVVKQYDDRLKRFNEHFVEVVGSAEVHYELISETLLQTSERLNPIAILSDLTKHCVAKYSYAIPTIIDVQHAIEKCVATAKSQQAVMITGAVDVRNALERYLEHHFEEEIKSCANVTSASKDFSCITAAATKASNYIHESQKNFATQVEAAICVAKAKVKRLLDCSFDVEQDTITEVAKANILINHCMTEEDRCKPCKYHCKELLELPVSELHSNLIHNPFLGREDHPQCLIVCVK